MDKKTLLGIGGTAAVAGAIIGGVLTLGGISGAQEKEITAVDKGDGIVEVTTVATEVQSIKLTEIQGLLESVEGEIVSHDQYCSVRSDDLAKRKTELQDVINQVK